MDIVLIAHNIRSTHNVGAILRSADGFGVSRVFCTGYTPYPAITSDTRLPHLRDKITSQIRKTALGAEKTMPITCSESVEPILAELKQDGYQLLALEQTDNSVALADFRPMSAKLALLLGEEVHGTPARLLMLCDVALEIPMRGKKESFNVSVATGIALYALDLLR